MQAIGFLSRREHSRQELRAKLLDSLRKRAREEAALAAAADKAAQALAEALREQPSNGIDDAFAPTHAAPRPHDAAGAARAQRGGRAGASRATRQARGARATACRPRLEHAGALDRPALDTLSLANGAPLPAALKASLAAAATAASTPGSAAPAWRCRRRRSHGVRRTLETARRVHRRRCRTRRPRPAATCRAPIDRIARSPADAELADPEAAVDELLDWLVANKYLSETRFVESRVNARSRKQGTLRIKLELSRHGLALEPEQAAALRETEFARAQALVATQVRRGRARCRGCGPSRPASWRRAASRRTSCAASSAAKRSSEAGVGGTPRRTRPRGASTVSLTSPRRATG